MSKVIKVDKDIADAMDLFLKEASSEFRSEGQTKAILVAEHYGQDWNNYEVGQYIALNKILTEDVMLCMVHGYEPIKEGEIEVPNNKVKIEKDIADAISLFMGDTSNQMEIESFRKMNLIADHSVQDWNTYKEGKYAALNKISTTDLINCLSSGYEPFYDSVEIDKPIPTKYLKTWTGVVTGSMAGRDDGYPITKQAMYDSIEDLTRNYKKDKDEKYYKLVDMEEEIEELAKTALKEEAEMERLKNKRKLEIEIKKMQDELALINHSEDNV